MKIIGVNLAYDRPTKIAVLSSRGHFLFLTEVKPDESLIVTAKRVHRAIHPTSNAMVVFEKMGLWGNAAAGMKLVQLAACLFVLLDESGFSVHQVRPQEWQRNILGELKKGESKSASIVAADKVFGFKIPHPITHDEADALNIALYGVNHYRKLIEERDKV